MKKKRYCGSPTEVFCCYRFYYCLFSVYYYFVIVDLINLHHSIWGYKLGEIINNVSSQENLVSDCDSQYHVYTYTVVVVII